VDAAQLEKTVSDYNEVVKAKMDSEFGRTSLDVELITAPYYAVEISPAVHHTMGGVTINTNTQVINNSGEVITGLFAAGEVTGGVHGANRIGGNAVTDITVFGKIAGMNATAFVK
ncbi:MAG: FAD-binding protein, partial [Sedimentibacter sp.]